MSSCHLFKNSIAACKRSKQMAARSRNFIQQLPSRSRYRVFCDQLDKSKTSHRKLCVNRCRAYDTMRSNGNEDIVLTAEFYLIICGRLSHDSDNQNDRPPKKGRGPPNCQNLPFFRRRYDKDEDHVLEETFCSCSHIPC